MTGRLIAFEGGDGSGKTTQARLLADHLGALVTREPGGTPFGLRVRDLLLDPATGAVDARAEALLVAADRAHHVATVVRPALAGGRHVVTDRYVGSSLAYQGYGRGLDVDEVRRLSWWATCGLEPDLVVLLDVPVEVAAARAGPGDRFEDEAGAFHARVADGYRRLAAADPDRWLVVDGTAPVEEVAAAVRAAVGARLGVGA